MQKVYKKSKAGISLITVLLFMMIATIAATATYKWITSEGRSSASRMLQREAYQSSIAGIENARAWMTYHANDVGALIKAYIDGGNKPVNIDDRLRTLQRAGQDYHVWLVGVNTEKSTYKLKILSSGEARNNTRHSEVAIFNVDGLYQVKVPQKRTKGEVDFKEAFFGSAEEGISLDVSSAIMNGNTEFNTKFDVTDYVIVTGDVSVNSSTNVGDLYVKGNLYSCTNFNVSGDAYVEETMYLNGTHSYGGDIYAKGGINMSGTGTGKAQCSTGPGGGITVAGNVSTENDIIMPRHTAGTNYIFNGNLVLQNGAKINFANLDEFNQVGSIPWTVRFNGNVYLDGGFTNGWHIGYARAANFSLGSEGKSIYSETPLYRVTNESGKIVYDHWKWNDNLINDRGDPKMVLFINKHGNWQHYSNLIENTYCDDERCAPTHDFSDSYFFRNDAFYCDWEWGWYNYGGWYGNQYIYKPVEACGCKWTYTSGRHHQGYRWQCDTKNRVKRNEIFMQINGTYVSSKPDTAGWGANRMQDFEDKITNENTGEGCGTSNHVKDPIQFNKELLSHNKLHSESNKGACEDLTLWNSWPSPHGWLQLNDCYKKAKAANELYDDTWLLVELKEPQWATDASDYLQGNFIIIIDGSSNGIYLPQTKDQEDGSKSNVIIYFPRGFDAIVNSAGGTNPMNYFLFSDGDLKNVQLGSSTINGSVFLTDCHNMGSTNTIQIQYNEDLTSTLAGSGIICNNDGTNSCEIGSTSGSSGSGSSEEGSTEGGYDSYYISMAPQLGITLESQYENNENIPTANSETELNPSFIVLPRVIYLPSDPYGYLSDYYNVLPLNGSRLKKEEISVGCSGISSSGKLFTGTNLTKGIYKCLAEAENHDNVPFWVVVGDDQRSTPAISFVEASVEMPASGNHEVSVSVPAHATAITLNVSCPTTAPTGWSYNLINGSQDGNNCSFILPASDVSQTIPLFNVTTSNAPSGTMIFSLITGEGYNLTSPYSMELHVSSSATLNRTEATSAEIKAFCDLNSGTCPDESLYGEWPECQTSETWVEPSTNFGINSINNSWTLSVGGSGIATLNSLNNDDCIVIIPTENNSLNLASLESNKTYTLRATAKSKQRTLTIGFKGNTEGTNPVLNISAGSRTSQCSYGDLPNDDKTCTISVFDGEEISLSIDTENNSDNENFSYWRCESGSCPTTDPISSDTYNAFSVSDDNTVIYAYFNEQDKHCFFDEFKNTSIECSSDETEYCIDDCGGTCSGTSGGEYSKAKWHLVTGSINDIIKEFDYLHLEKTIGKKGNNNSAVRVLSTVNAGIYGTMKALFQLPKATSSYGDESANISQSGFMLRSNNSATEYLMLNLYVNKDGKLEAKLCTENNDNCASQFLRNSSNNEASVSTSNMIMMSATLSAENLIVSAFTGNYYGDPTEYTTSFDMNSFPKYSDRAHEFVGFSLADENFKLYGIGWKSEDYASECHDTYPTVKCSFAAVAQNGIIPTDSTVKPWVGHSGWFDSESCNEQYYYYNGTDACNGIAEGSVECSSDGYSFSESGAGVHGYLEEDKEVKTAKAWLDCTPSSEEKYAWATASENERAHCGLFWTGKFTECTTHEELIGDTIVISNETQSIAFDASHNLRGTNLNIVLDNPNNAEVEIWLLSENDAWGAELIESQPVKMTNNSASFEMSSMFTEGSEGFDPENVKSIVLKTTGLIALQAVTTSCKNAIGISNCVASYKDELGKWSITAEITNKDKVSGYKVLATIDGSEEFSIAENPTWNGNKATFELADNPYSENQGAAYAFTATIYSEDLEYSTNCGEVIIGTIGCSANIDGSSAIASGAKNPKLSAYLSGCPDSGCKYNIYLDDTLVEENASGSGSISFTADGTQTCSDAEGCKHTYKIESTDSDFPFEDCSAEFTVLLDTSIVSASCGVSKNNWGISGESIFYTSEDLYFMAKNNSSNANTPTMEIFKDGVSQGQKNLNQWSNITELLTIGKLDAGNYKYSINHNGNEICSHSIEVKSGTADCNITGNLFENQNITMNVTNMAGFSGNVKMIWSLNGVDVEIECNTGDCWSNTRSAPSVAGTYPYTLTYNGTNICSGEIEIKNALSCSVDKTTIGLGESFAFTTSYAGDAWNHELSGNGAPSSTGGSATYSITPTAIGTHTYTFKVTNGSLGVAECSETITVEEVAPKITCPADLTGIGLNSNVPVTPQSLTGCVSGCGYTISTTEGTGYAAEISGYTGGAVSFTGEGSAGSYNYTWNVYNSTGSDDCEFSVTYEKGGDYTLCLGNDAGWPEITNITAIGSYQIIHDCQGTETYSYFYNCSNGAQISWNGNALICDGNEKQAVTTHMPMSGTILTIMSGSISKIGCNRGSGTSPCETTGITEQTVPTITCPADLTGIGLGESVSITPQSVTGCAAGCKYKISGGSTNISTDEFTYSGGAISITGESSADTYPYTLNVTNSIGESTPCSFNITYEEGGSGGSNSSITLQGNWSDDRTGYSDGTYIINHSCSSSGYGVYYHCCKGTTIKWGDLSLTCTATVCDGSDTDKYAGHEKIINANSIPPTGSAMIISGGKLSKIGCQ